LSFVAPLRLLPAEDRPERREPAPRAVRHVRVGAADALEVLCHPPNRVPAGFARLRQIVKADGCIDEFGGAV